MASDPPPQPQRPPLPWRTRLFTAAISTLHGASLRSDGTVNRLLLSVFDRHVRPKPTPIAGVSTSDHALSGHLRVRLFTPTTTTDSNNLPVVVYIHGGGFVFHSPATGLYDTLCRRLAAAIPATIASVDYRLAPEHHFPAACDDGVDALHWVLAGAGGALPTPPAAVFLAGDSAGGNIAHHVARRSSPAGNVAGLVSIQPFFGAEAAMPSETRLGWVPFGSPERAAWLWRAFLPAGATRDHEAANVLAGLGRTTDPEEPPWRGFPPVMVCIGGWDAYQDRQRAYVDGLRAAGVEVHAAEYPDAIHAFYLFPELADSDRMVADVAEFVNRRMEHLKI